MKLNKLGLPKHPYSSYYEYIQRRFVDFHHDGENLIHLIEQYR